MPPRVPKKFGRRLKLRERLGSAIDEWLESPAKVSVMLTLIMFASCVAIGLLWWYVHNGLLSGLEDDGGADDEAGEMAYTEAMWEMWTFMADAGSHADAVRGCDSRDADYGPSWSCWIRSKA